MNIILDLIFVALIFIAFGNEKKWRSLVFKTPKVIYYP